MMGRKEFKAKIFYGLNLNEMIPKDHLVRVLTEVLDLRFVRELCKSYYSHTGQPSVDPVVLLKMMLLGYLYGITSERRLAEECSLNLAFRWYLGYDFDELTPNHSVISKARVRFGKQVFEEFFQRVLAICVQKGLVKGEKIFADATLVRANASIKSLTPRPDAPSPSISPREFIDKIFEDNQVEEDSRPGEKAGQEPRDTALKGTSLYRERDSSKLSHRDMPRVLRPKYRRRHKSNIDHMSRTDPEASFIGRPGKGAFFCYKYHFTVDGDGRVVTSVAVTPGAVTEEHMLGDLLERQPVMVGEVCADSQYGTAENYALCWRKGIKPSMPRRRVARKKGRIPQEEFTYVPDRDIYTCPNGKELRRLTYDKRVRRWHYRPRVRDCRACPLKPKCCPRTTIRTFVRAVEQEFIDRAMEWLKTPESRESLKQRSMFAEWAVAEAKTLYGLSKARYRGLEKVTIQALMTAAVQNIKRLIALRNRIGRGSSLLLDRTDFLLCWSGCSTPSFSTAHFT